MERQEKAREKNWAWCIFEDKRSVCVPINRKR